MSIQNIINNYYEKNNIGINSHHNYKYLVITPGHVGTSFLENILRINNKKSYGTHLLIDLLHALDEGNKTIITIMRNPINRNISKFYTDIHYGTHKGEKEIYHHHRMYNYYGPNESQVLNLSKENINELFNIQKYHYLVINWMEAFEKIIGIDFNNFNKEKGMQVYNLKNNNKLIVLVNEKMNNNINEIIDEINCKKMKYENIKISNKKSELWKKIQNDLVYKNEYLIKNFNHPIMKKFYTNEMIIEFKSKFKL